MTQPTPFQKIEDLLRQAAQARRDAGALPEAPVGQAEPHAPTPEGSIPLSQIVIDPDQPRRYLPADLREALRNGGLTADTALQALLERAASGDAVAGWHARDITALAANIRAVGLQQPIRVWRDQAKDGSTLFRIIDGERRFWAHVYLLAQGGPVASRWSHIAASIAPDAWSLDDVHRAQWAANLNRRDVPVIELALAVRAIFERNERRFAVNKQPFLDRLGKEAADLTEFEQLVALTALDVGDLLARPLKPPTIRAYLGIARNLSDESVIEARARNAGFRALMAAASRQSPESQLEFLRSLNPQRSAEYAEDEGDRPAPASRSLHAVDAGRPTRDQALMRRISALQDGCGRMGRNLHTLSPEALQTLLAALDDLDRTLDGTRQTIRKALTFKVDK